ncbi:THO complex subunit 4 [Sporothrix schenckii 1099-18]|uniref:THO complex subunit 4 n=1 Tax=Sporothrix schenckii 1099-18 TaxID=1397361 RepID=A0A0F2MBF9_SPOSC|nr:THO complex subunit 4 [Sporothrix schenckii 1099-18]KJR87028.1 THO complex subunit 4 [Sporothrix schenckii 1099-18]
MAYAFISDDGFQKAGLTAARKPDTPHGGPFISQNFAVAWDMAQQGRFARTGRTVATTKGSAGWYMAGMRLAPSNSRDYDYFGQAVGQVKRVELSYGPGGVSRGIATVVFHHADGASKAFSELNGLLIDNRAVKVEVVVAKAELIPQPKTLGQRITQPKAQPKSAATDKRAGNAAKGASNQKANNQNNANKKPGQGRRARSARPAKKTAEELDSEMADYFVSNGTATNGATAPAAAPAAAAAAPAAATADAPMDDDIM